MNKDNQSQDIKKLQSDVKKLQQLVSALIQENGKLNSKISSQNTEIERIRIFINNRIRSS